MVVIRLWHKTTITFIVVYMNFSFWQETLVIQTLPIQKCGPGGPVCSLMINTRWGFSLLSSLFKVEALVLNLTQRKCNSSSSYWKCKSAFVFPFVSHSRQDVVMLLCCVLHIPSAFDYSRNSCDFASTDYVITGLKVVLICWEMPRPKSVIRIVWLNDFQKRLTRLCSNFRNVMHHNMSAFVIIQVVFHSRSRLLRHVYYVGKRIDFNWVYEVNSQHLSRGVESTVWWSLSAPVEQSRFGVLLR